MTWRHSARFSILVAVAVAAAAILGTFGLAPSTASTSPVTDDTRSGSRPGTDAGRRHLAPRDAVTVFDDVPAVTGLDPDLLDALRRAATDAGDDGVAFVVNSGRRSPADQRRLLREAVSQYGSEAEAARWVATADTSPHVSGDAIDVGPSDAAAWLSDHGAAYGLCQIYGNEPWHYELRRDAVEHGCPRLHADPTHDPRMQP